MHIALYYETKLVTQRGKSHRIFNFIWSYLSKYSTSDFYERNLVPFEDQRRYDTFEISLTGVFIHSKACSVWFTTSHNRFTNDIFT